MAQQTAPGLHILSRSASESDQGLPAPRIAQNPRVALVIEDDKVTSSLLVQMLDRLSFQVAQVRSAEAARDFLATSSVDLVLLELHLPGQSGDDWLQWFRHTDINTPVIAVCAVHDPLRKAMVLQLGADDFVSKPFDLVELEARVQAVMRRPGNSATRTICNGSVCLDPARAELRAGDTGQLLSTCEFGIVWHLGVHEGQWVDVRSLSTAILGTATPPNIETTRVHVSNVRRKLAHLSPYFVIESGRLRGYRLVNGWE
jgi:DNA-binding response OmpR family regulator